MRNPHGVHAVGDVSGEQRLGEAVVLVSAVVVEIAEG